MAAAASAAASTPPFFLTYPTHGPIWAINELLDIPSSSLIAVINKHPSISASISAHEHVLGYAHIDSSRIAGQTFTDSGTQACQRGTISNARQSIWAVGNGASPHAFRICAIRRSGSPTKKGAKLKLIPCTPRRLTRQPQLSSPGKATPRILFRVVPPLLAIFQISSCARPLQ